MRPAILHVALVFSALVLTAQPCPAQPQGRGARAARSPREVPTNTISVASLWPGHSVEIQVSKLDVHGLRNGWTPFTREFRARGAVQLKAPPFANDNPFHHWDIEKSKYLRTSKIRVMPSRDVQATAVFLHACGAASFEYRSTRRRDSLIARGFDPPLSNLFAYGKATAFGIRGTGNDRTPLHGPFTLEPRGNGVMWMYNGTKQRTAVIRCYPEHDLVVYVAYTNLPHEFELFYTANEPPYRLRAAPHEQH